MKKLFAPVLAVLLMAGAGGFLACPIPTAEAVDLPANTGFVTDTVGLLSSEQKLDLDAELKDYENRTGTEIAILIVANTGGMAAPDYAIEVANKWGVGKKGVDNGALVLVAMERHNIFIAVGRQLEGALTDAQAGAITRLVMRPRFKQGNFYGGLKQGVLAMEKTIAGESFTEKRMSGAGQNFSFQKAEMILFFVVVAFSWLAAVLGRTKEIWPGGAIGGAIGAGIAWYLSYTLLTILVAAGVCGVLGLAFDWVVSRNFDRFTKGGPMPPWFMGGGGFFGGGSSGGGEGFGGGSFSGGGGGSDW